MKPWVKISRAPGGQVVSGYYATAGIQEALETLGFNLVGYGCATCIGNFGPLPVPIAIAAQEKALVVAAVLTGNRNFESHIHPRAPAISLRHPSSWSMRSRDRCGRSQKGPSHTWSPRHADYSAILERRS